MARRLLAIATALESLSREAAARAAWTDRQTLRDWVIRYNRGGPAGLSDHWGDGRPCRLTEGQQATLKAIVLQGPDPEVDGVSTWRPAAQLPACTHAAILIDNAGWHIANDLCVPPNISLVHLPPYSPELNGIEKVWQYLRDCYLSGRLFSGTRAIVDACCDAWNKLITETGRIQSLTDFEWARQVSP